jgi:DNA-directed RNA polymerase specialized sigma54-like protein
MIQSWRSCNCPSALQERIQQELQENPVLELKEESDEPGSTVEAEGRMRPSRRLPTRTWKNW